MRKTSNSLSGVDCDSLDSVDEPDADRAYWVSCESERRATTPMSLAADVTGDRAGELCDEMVLVLVRRPCDEDTPLPLCCGLIDDVIPGLAAPPVELESRE